MAKDAIINARVESELKNNVEKIFKKLGVSTTEAITIYFNQIIMHKGLPFEVKIPNKTSRKTFEDTDKGKNLKIFKDKKDFMNDLGL